MKKTKRKLLAVLLAFTMLFGSSMTVFAQDYEWDDIQEGTILQNGDTISVTGYVHSNIPNTDLVDTAVSISIGNHENMNAFGNNNYNYGNISETTVLSCEVINVQNDKVLKVTGKAMSEPTAFNYEFKVSVEERISETVPQTPSTNPTNPTNNKPTEEPSKIEEVHSHSYSWVTVQEATTEQDGMEEYRCSCGAVA